MLEIEKLRSELDQIHEEMAQLFKKRLQLTSKIWQIKKSNGLPYFDKEREERVIHRFDNSIENSDERLVVQRFFESMLNENKKYLEAQFK